MLRFSFFQLVRRLAVCLLTGIVGVGAVWLFALSQLPRAAHAAVATLSPTPSWVADGDTPNMIFGSSVASAGDVNHDGYADVIIGATNYLSNTGRAFLYLGSASGLASTPAFTLTGSSIGAWLGLAVSTAGDVNGDGYADVVIGGASDNCAVLDTPVYVFYGSATGLNATASVTLTQPTPCNAFGVSVATAGDLNGDGYADVMVGAPHCLSYIGCVYFYLGSPSGLAPTPTFTATGAVDIKFFGSTTNPAGDVNGDGFSDIMVTARYSDTNQGLAYVYLGSVTGINPMPALTLAGAISYSPTGNGAGSAGDVNGDGYADFLTALNAPFEVHLYLGGPTLTDTPALTLTNSHLQFVSAAGDVNGDGYADVMVSEPNPGYTGSVSIYAGSTTGLQTTPIFTATSGFAGDVYGGALSTAGDVNGDHVDDILVAAYYHQNYAGRVYVYHGVADAPPYIPPQANADVYTLSEDSPLTVFTATGVLTNDTATNLNLLTAVSATLPTTGTLALQADGAFTYTPPLNFNGLVTFTYHTFDQTAYSLPAVVTLTVTPVNDTPTVSPIADQLIFFNASTPPLSFTIGDVDNPPATLTVTVASDNPALIANSGLALGGSDSARTLTLTPTLNQTGSALITLTVTDGTIPVSTTFQLTVTALRLYLPFILR